MGKIRLAFFEKKLVTMQGALTKSEKKIAEYICENPEEFTKLATTELSENIHTSIAAITRFTKKMGYDKLQDLKLDITRDLEATVNYKSRGLLSEKPPKDPKNLNQIWLYILNQRSKKSHTEKYRINYRYRKNVETRRSE